MARSKTLLTMWFRIQSLAVLFCLSAEALPVDSRNSATLGFTDNANYESSEKDADFFLDLSSANSVRNGPWEYRLRLGYENYFSQNPNDAVSWKLSSAWNKFFSSESELVLEGGAFGYHYVNIPPGTTDENFSSAGFRMNSEHTLPVGEGASVAYGMDYEFRAFSSIPGRIDSTFLLHGAYSREIEDDWVLEPFLNIAFIPSTLGVYSRRYAELGVSADYRFAPRARLAATLFYRNTAFPSRVIGSQEIVGRRGRSGAVRVVSENEAYNLVYLGAHVFYALSSQVETGLGLSHLSQRSRSGWDDYSVNQVLLQMVLSF